MENKITSERLVDDDVLKPLGDSASRARVQIEALNLALIEITKNAAKDLIGGVDPKDLVALQKKSEAIDKINAAEKAQIKILNEKAKLAKEEIDYRYKLAKQRDKEKADEKALLDAVRKANEEKKNANKQTAEQIRIGKQRQALNDAEVGSLNELKARLALVTIQYNKISEAHRENTVTGKLLLIEQNALTESLNKAEQAGGNFHRQVGNYGKASIILGKGMAGLVGLVSTLGNAFGIHTEMIENMHAVSKTLIKTTRELSHSLHLEHLGHKETAKSVGEEIVAKEAEVVVEKEVAVAKSATLGLIGLGIAALGALIVVVWDYISAENAEKEETRKSNIVKKAKIDLLIIQRKLERETAEEMRKIQNELLVAEGKLTEAQAKKSDNQAKMEVQRDEIFKKTRAALNELGQYKEGDEKLTYEEKLAELKKYHIYETQEQKEHWEKMGRLEEQDPDRMYDERLQEDPKIKLLKAKDEAIRALQDEWDAEDLHVDAEVKIKKIEADKKFYEKQLSLKQKFLLEMRGGVKSDADEEARNEKAGMDKLTKIKNQNEKEIEEHEKEVEAWKKAEFDRLYSLQKLKEEDEKKKKEERDKRIDEEEKQIQSLIDLWSKYSDARNEQNRKVLDRENQNIESSLQVQAALMAKGEANTYSAVLKQRNENMLKQAALDKKERQQKERQQIATIFLKFMDVYAKDGWAGIAKAAGATTATELFADALAGKAYEGTEDTGRGSNMDEKGGALWMLHPHERVLSAQQNKMIGDLTNEELVQAVMMKDMYDPKMNVPQNMQGHDMTLMRMVISTNKEVINAIKNKKEVQYSKNFVGETVRTEIENGIKRIYIDKRNRLRPNG